jgi:hypothetical protein
MTQSIAKKLWSFLLRRRDPAPQVFLLQDDNKSRVLSVALAICDVLRLDRSETLHKVALETWTATRDLTPANNHIYDTRADAGHLKMVLSRLALENACKCRTPAGQWLGFGLGRF